ncbi:MAG: hypothetical protein EBS01_00750 [Verrucomicrobia bacterium]|nr:hypothetical protein [Verrucomicrobiota bacterium]
MLRYIDQALRQDRAPKTGWLYGDQALDYTLDYSIDGLQGTGECLCPSGPALKMGKAVHTTDQKRFFKCTNILAFASLEGLRDFRQEPV